MCAHTHTHRGYRLLPPTSFSVWFLANAARYQVCQVREDGILFSMTGGRSADNQVNEKESHLEQRAGGSARFLPILLVFHSSASLKRLCIPHVACKYYTDGCITKDDQAL